jgi:hypothetical protein
VCDGTITAADAAALLRCKQKRSHYFCIPAALLRCKQKRSHYFCIRNLLLARHDVLVYIVDTILLSFIVGAQGRSRRRPNQTDGPIQSIREPQWLQHHARQGKARQGKARQLTRVSAQNDRGYCTHHQSTRHGCSSGPPPYRVDFIHSACPEQTECQKVGAMTPSQSLLLVWDCVCRPVFENESQIFFGAPLRLCKVPLPLL